MSHVSQGKTTSKREKQWTERVGNGAGSELRYRLVEHGSSTMRSTEGVCEEADQAACGPAKQHEWDRWWSGGGG